MEDGTYGTTRPRIETHVCTREELGLTEDRSKATFLPTYEASKGTIDFYHKKMLCVNPEDLYTYGDYNSYQAS